jgi:hypothetical protein
MKYLPKFLLIIVINLFLFTCQEQNIGGGSTEFKDQVPKGVCNALETLCISDIKIAEKTFSSFSMSWKATEGASTYIIYRKSDSSDISESDAVFATAETITQTVKGLAAKTKYYYKIYATMNMEAVETAEVPITTEEKSTGTGTVCGDEKCDANEDAASCIVDCGTVSSILCKLNPINLPCILY